MEAYQSYIWNATARLLIQGGCSQGAMVEAPDPFGRMLFPEAASVPVELRALDVPILGHKSKLEEPWQAAARSVLANEGITTAELEIPGLRRPYFGEARRPLFVAAREFRMGQPQRDEFAQGPPRLRRRLEFVLPRGAYATVLLRAMGQ